MEGFLRSMSEINSYSIPVVQAAETRPRVYSNDTSGRRNLASSASFEEAIANAAGSPRAKTQSSGASRLSKTTGERESSPTSQVPLSTESAPPTAAANGPFMMPMQQSWTAPVVPVTPAEYPIHPVYGVPMVSEATLNRYIHPLQPAGAIAPGLTETTGDIGTTVYRVAPDGLQDFVTTDGYRHRFDVEIVFPSPASFTWQDRDAREMHPEVADFASTALREKLASSGMDVAKLQITPFRMTGGNESRPWFLDQLVLKMDGKQELPVSLNVAMRDPEYTIASIKEFWNQEALATREIPS